MLVRLLSREIALAIALGGVVTPSFVQTTATATQPSHKSRAVVGSPKIYEDREVKVHIPAGWKIVPDSALKPGAGPAVTLGNSVSQAYRKLILEKNGYTLGIAYHTDHASGVEGGRFIEIFSLSWPGIDDAWNCSLYLQHYPQPASRQLIFINVIVDSGNEKVRENCAVPQDLGAWTQRNGEQEYEGERRWFGGYFEVSGGGYFFGSDTEGCGLKAYTLTSQASAPDQLPDAGNPVLGNVPSLEKTISEAIDIVDSIHYKRCSPF